MENVLKSCNLVIIVSIGCFRILVYKLKRSFQLGALETLYSKLTQPQLDVKYVTSSYLDLVAISQPHLSSMLMLYNLVIITASTYNTFTMYSSFPILEWLPIILVRQNLHICKLLCCECSCQPYIYFYCTLSGISQQPFHKI